MKREKTKGDIERDERDVEDMRKDDEPVVAEAHVAKGGRGVRVAGVPGQDNATTGLSRPSDAIFGDNQQP